MSYHAKQWTLVFPKYGYKEAESLEEARFGTLDVVTLVSTATFKLS